MQRILVVATLVVVVALAGRNAGDPLGDICTNAAVFAVQNTTEGVKITLRSNNYGRQQDSVIFPGQNLPRECGVHSTRCALGLVKNSSRDDRIVDYVLLVPLDGHVGLVTYRSTNGSIPTYHANVTHSVPHAYDCQVVSFLNLEKFIAKNPQYRYRLPNILGVCFRESDAASVRLLNIPISFDFSGAANSVPTSNVITSYDDGPEIMLTRNGPVSGPISGFVPILDVPSCLPAETMIFYFDNVIDRTMIGFFDVTTQVADQYEVFKSEEGSRSEDRFNCSSTAPQVVRISDSVLVVYCQNTSAEVNICNISSRSVRARIYENGQIRYHCSSDRSSFVNVSEEGNINYFNATTGPTLSVRRSSEDDIYSANCFKTNRESDSVLFVSTTNAGVTNLTDLVLGDTVSLGRIENGEDGLAVHQVYNDMNILLNNGSSTILYNTSCAGNDRIQVTIDHPHHLALYVSFDGNHPCNCVDNTDGSTMATDVPSSATTKNTGKIIRSTVGITLMISVAMVIASIS